MNKISLIITVSRKKFLEQALCSVQNQTYKEFDLVIVIDNHKEKDIVCYTASLISKLFSEWESSIVIKEVSENKNSAGVIRNIGFSLAKTEWIAYLDDDDELDINAIAVMISYIDKYGKGIYSSGIYKIDSKGNRHFVSDSIIWKPTKELYSGDPVAVNKPIYCNQFQAIQKKEWEKYMYDSRMGEDLDFVMNHLVDLKFIKVPYYLYGYRMNEDSLSHQKDIDLFTQRYENGYYYVLFNENMNGNCDFIND